MKKDTVYAYSHDFEDISFDKSEILRYMGYKRGSENKDINTLIEKSIYISKDVIKPKCAFMLKEMKADGSKVIFDDFTFNSKSLSKNLSFCNYGILLCATLGVGADLLIDKYSVLDMSVSLCLSAFLNAYIEGYVDFIQDILDNELNRENLFKRPRFSPGYADFSLDNQGIILDKLNALKFCNLTKTSSCILTPKKSVTAVIGYGEKSKCNYTKCEICDKENCEFKGGK